MVTKIRKDLTLAPARNASRRPVRVASKYASRSHAGGRKRARETKRQDRKGVAVRSFAQTVSNFS
jgi:hypothetical protein